MKNVKPEFRSKVTLEWELSTGHIVNKEREFEILVIALIQGFNRKKSSCDFN
jgi:hypothetical protein